MCPQSPKKLQYSDITSIIEGKDLGELVQVWRDAASSEMRLNLMSDLKGKNLGFGEIEKFSLGLNYNLKSKRLKEQPIKPNIQVIKSAMDLKMKDERYMHIELMRKKEEKRKWLGGVHHPNTRSYRRVIGFLREEAKKMKEELDKKYRDKLDHLQTKYRGDEEEKLAPPAGLENLSHLRVFSSNKYDNIPAEEIKVPRIGEITLSEEEESILRKNPKFAIPQPLLENSLKEDMEKAYCKLRMELRDEEDEGKLSAEVDRSSEEVEEQGNVDEAKARQIYDPILNIYDDRKRRVTDLAECSRVVLPKPLTVIREAQIEFRREVHDRIYQEYRKEYCNEEGEQESNLDAGEKRGLKSLMKRIKTDDLVIVKTDKSGKMSATDRDTYIKMGMEHVKGDKIVSRARIKEVDKIMNEHCMAWCGIWGTGQQHGQEDRILASKTSRSENTARLYLTHKDHKAAPNKTRPIGTANSSNTRAFANSVSDFLEAVANAEEEKTEVISSEDMLHNVNKGNIKKEELIKRWKSKKFEKESCIKCKIWKLRCRNCAEKRAEASPGLGMCEERRNETQNTSLSSSLHKSPPTNLTRSPPPLKSVKEILEGLIEEAVKKPSWIMDLEEEIIDNVMMVAFMKHKEEVKDCEECEELVAEELKKRSCETCEELYKEDKIFSLVGMDAVSLFPSMSADETGKIVRKRVEMSKLKVDGFNWKKASIYIKINKDYTSGIPREVRKYLPVRKSNRGTEPGMGSKGLKIEKGSEKQQWYFHWNTPPEEIQKMMRGLITEIAIKILWGNYIYKFGGETYEQEEGGPIGQRPTMAASRIVMHDFMVEYEKILKTSGIEILVLKIYVDDGRQVTTLMKKGMRFDKEEQKFSWTKEAEDEDAVKEMEGEKKDEFMARLCLPAMNSVNRDLTFTAEVASDFENKKLPTLDFSLWRLEDQSITHSFFEKEMRSQKLIENRNEYSLQNLIDLMKGLKNKRKEIPETPDIFNLINSICQRVIEIYPALHELLPLEFTYSQEDLNKSFTFQNENSSKSFKSFLLVKALEAVTPNDVGIQRYFFKMERQDVLILKIKAKYNDDIKERDGKIASLLKIKEKSDNDIASKNAKITESIEQMKAKHDDEIKEKDGKIASLLKIKEKSDNDIASKNAKIKESIEQMKAKHDDEIKEKDGKIASKLP